MDDLGPLIQLFIYGTPFWVLAILAIFATHPSRVRPVGRLVRNRFALLGVMALAATAFAFSLALVVLSIGGCDGGLIDPVTCTALPQALGSALNSLAFKAVATGSAIGLPSLGCYVLAEIITRHRAKGR
jgi:hypothetical protein